MLCNYYDTLAADIHLQLHISLLHITATDCVTGVCVRAHSSALTSHLQRLLLQDVLPVVYSVERVHSLGVSHLMHHLVHTYTR
jgi:hypothetical protein